MSKSVHKPGKFSQVDVCVWVYETNNTKNIKPI